jgi:membrane-bound PQQ-dependent dehydrogenase (glucose/quinate/shikimate family)
VQWIFAAFLLVTGGYLAIRGGDLIGLGGSWYYALAGVALIAVAVLISIRNAWGPRVYAGIVAITVVWAIAEAGLDLMALLPRLDAWLVVGLWFLTPWHRAAMRRSPDRKPASGALLVGGAMIAGVLLLAIGALQGYRVEQGTDTHVAGAGITDWRNYGNQVSGQRFAQLDQINLESVGKLKEAWRFRTGVPGDFKATSIQAGELLYFCTAGNIIVALDAETGAERWRFDPKVVFAPGTSYTRTCRGVSYHEAAPTPQLQTPATPARTSQPGAPTAPAECPKRILAGTTDARLIAIDALTGEKCRSFGFDGEINLRSGMGPHPPVSYFLTSPPLVAGNTLVVGGWVSDLQQLGLPSGVIRAYDATTGKFIWAWDMGNPGYRGLPDEGGEYTRGTPNSWSLMSYDPQLNLVYAPTGNSSPDYFDGDLRTEYSEKYASSVLAIDAATGELRWSYQTVHRDIWDYDVPAQPVLVDIRKDGVGELIPAVAAPTKRGEVFLLDRRTGVPIYDTPEMPVPQNPEPGEEVAATQPMSPRPNFRPDRHEQDMWGLTPLDQLFCRIEFKKMRYDGHFTPPMRGGGGSLDGQKTWGGAFHYPGNTGGFNWGSVSVDADNGLLVAAPMMLGSRIVLLNEEDRAKGRAWREKRIASGEIPARVTTPPYELMGPADVETPLDDPKYAMKRVTYTAATSPFMSSWRIPFTDIGTQLPCFEPPWSMIGVVDLNTNTLLWKRPFGSMKKSGPFGIESGLPFMVGTPLQAGSMTTRGGLIFHAGSMDATLRAFDLRNGKVKWEAALPNNAHATPMSYLSSRNGKQYVVITVGDPGWRYFGGGPRRPGGTAPAPSQGGYVIAYALPDQPA